MRSWKVGVILRRLSTQRAVGIEDQLRVVERAVVALVDAEHDHDAVLRAPPPPPPR